LLLGDDEDDAMAAPVVVPNPAAGLQMPPTAAGPGGAGSTVFGDDEGTTVAGRGKSSLVLAAEKVDRRTALLAGFLRKKNSEERWQKRYFELLGNFWVYYKNASLDQPILCAMDLWRAGAPELLPPGPADAEACEFSITWDRYRIFRAASRAEAQRWVNAIQQVQATRPPETVDRARALAGPPTPVVNALVARGGAAGDAVPASSGNGKAGGDARDWIDASKGGRGSGAKADARTDGSANAGGGGKDDGANSDGGLCSSCAIC